MKTINEGQVNKKQEAKKTETIKGVICSNPGKSIAPVYKRIYIKELDKYLVKKVDETNITEFIQASASQTDLATIQKRFLELGEIPQVDPSLVYSEDVVIPSNIHEVYDMVNDVSSNFGKLPESVRSVFGTKENYLKALLDGSYNSQIIQAFNKPAEEKQEEKEGN